MKSILEQLYYGQLSPWENMPGGSGKNTAQREQYLEHYRDFRHSLQALDPSLYRKFMALSDEETKLFASRRFDSFRQGFRLGTRIILEVLGTVDFSEAEWKGKEDGNPF